MAEAAIPPGIGCGAAFPGAAEGVGMRCSTVITLIAAGPPRSHRLTEEPGRAAGAGRPFGASATSDTLRNPAELTRLITSSTRP